MRHLEGGAECKVAAAGRPTDVDHTPHLGVRAGTPEHHPKRRRRAAAVVHLCLWAAAVWGKAGAVRPVRSKHPEARAQAGPHPLRAARRGCYCGSGKRASSARVQRMHEHSSLGTGVRVGVGGAMGRSGEGRVGWSEMGAERSHALVQRSWQSGGKHTGGMHTTRAHTQGVLSGAVHD